MKLSSRMAALAPERAFSVLSEAKALEAQGRKILHFEIGQPDFPTPKNIVEAGERALAAVGVTAWAERAVTLPDAGVVDHDGDAFHGFSGGIGDLAREGEPIGGGQRTDQDHAESQDVSCDAAMTAGPVEMLLLPAQNHR